MRPRGFCVLLAVADSCMFVPTSFDLENLLLSGSENRELITFSLLCG